MDLIKYVGDERKVTVPKEVWGSRVTQIACNCFGGSDEIEVYIPETVIIIGDTLENTDSIFSSNNGRPCGTIVTTENSYAQTYAINLGIPCRIVSEEEMRGNEKE
ncbi:hypothetical protein AALA79_21640 [Lachnospiraceae bacterium 64-25]